MSPVQFFLLPHDFGSTQSGCSNRGITLFDRNYEKAVDMTKGNSGKDYQLWVAHTIELFNLDSVRLCRHLGGLNNFHQKVHVPQRGIRFLGIGRKLYA